MADFAKVSLGGLAQVDERLAGLGRVAGEKVMRSALFAASKPIVDAARGNATMIQRSGALAKAIRRVFVKRSGLQVGFNSGSQFVVTVAPKIRDRIAVSLANLVYKRRRPIRGVFWGHLVEWGFTHFRSGTKIPGRLIFTKALNDTAERAITLFREVIGRKVERAAQGRSND